MDRTERALAHASQAFGTLQIRDLLKALNTRTDGAGLGGLEVLLAKSRNSEELRHVSFFEGMGRGVHAGTRPG